MQTLLDTPPASPIELFQQWLSAAESAEPNDPNAAALATASADGEPSVRMVLVKRMDEHGFWFFTNAESAKGSQLAANPRASLCFHWKSLRRQVRVSGPVSPLSDEDSDAYFHSRSRRSQIGAAVSQQSRPLPGRAALEEQVKHFEAAHPGEILRPGYWRGFKIAPSRIEFWADGPDRLHDRMLYTRENESWSQIRLYP